MRILQVETMGAERQNFEMYRGDIGNQYIFIHFLTPVKVILGGKTEAVKPGGCIFFKKNSTQHFISDECNLLHDWFHMDVECEKLIEKYNLECGKIYYTSDSEKITSIISDIETEYINKYMFYNESAISLLENLCVILKRAEIGDNSEYIDELQKQSFIRLRAEIHMNYDKQWTVEKMAALSNLSVSRFYFLYKMIFGISPMNDLIRKRIQMARTIILNRNMTVEELAIKVGYSNVYHFIRQFKALTGTTPGRMIKNNKSFR